MLWHTVLCDVVSNMKWLTIDAAWKELIYAKKLLNELPQDLSTVKLWQGTVNQHISMIRKKAEMASMTVLHLSILHAGNDETAIVLNMKLLDLSQVFSFI